MRARVCVAPSHLLLFAFWRQTTRIGGGGGGASPLAADSLLSRLNFSRAPNSIAAAAGVALTQNTKYRVRVGEKTNFVKPLPRFARPPVLATTHQFLWIYLVIWTDTGSPAPLSQSTKQVVVVRELLARLLAPT